ncbi:MAG: right-handed parallel beta-helix repeat-containing protein [Bryobacteraceae bacterium]
MKHSAVVFVSCSILAAATYEVGPGKPLAKIADVPWARLAPGDLVLINARPDAYKEKWVIGRSGTAAAPIVVRGVPGADGKLPVIDANGAVSVPGLVYQNAERGLIKIGGSDVPSDAPRAQYITIENLEVRGARRGNAYFPDGAPRITGYADNAAGIYIERGNNVTIRNCILRDNGNGLFLGIGRDFLFEGNYVVDNGYGGDDDQHHNIYLQGVGVTLQYNQFGPLKPGSQGNNIKDRSAGLVVRYNWIEGGNRELDMVEHGDPEIQNDPRFNEAFVYGNVIIEYQANDNFSFMQYGGDAGNPALFRKGPVHVYNNTMVSFRTDGTVLLRLSGQNVTADVRNNVVHMASGATLLVSLDFGTFDLRNNWLQRGYRRAEFDIAPSVIRDLGGNIVGTDPGLTDVKGLDFRPAAGSPLLSASAPLAANELPVLREYVKHQQSRERVSGARDIGAYEGRAPSPTLSQLGVSSPNSFLSLYGQDLSRATTAWDSAIVGGRLPTELETVRVRVDGKDAVLHYVSPSQINILTPPDVATGDVALEVTTPFGLARSRLQIVPAAPFVFGYPSNGKVYAAALFNGTANLITPSAPAKTGDNIVLYATGLGPTTPAPPPGQVLTDAYPLTDLAALHVTLGGAEALVQYAGMTFAGVFQVNVQVPQGVNAGDQAVVIRTGSQSSQSNIFLAFR